MVAQLEESVTPSLDHVERTKSLICALNFISRDLPLPPELFDTVSSIYYGHQEGVTEVLDDGVHAADGSDQTAVAEKGLVLVWKFVLLEGGIGIRF
ncbi:hypothetical protein Pint_24870 [Pistacia integerrima]|uniref:Uncharacterized protein n=1 Tax=Pistacia integerrima TaxID=434235 RepID=A0ACC0YAU2_9ROSI|nr:hypothetical protein Pint_24870 [Pistacia integerrima]